MARVSVHKRYGVPRAHRTGRYWGRRCAPRILAGFIRGETIERTLKLAAACGGLNVQVHDAVSGIVPYEEVDSLMKGWSKVEMAPPGEGWRYDRTEKVFVKK